MRKILGCFIFIMIMITSQIFAATYYVDATNGSDSNSGTSQGIAWKTINKVNNSYFYPGDSILFKRGEIWREQLTIPSSGNLFNQIIFGTYGTGLDPIINGADLVTSWMVKYANVWQAPLTPEPRVVFFNSSRGNKQTSLDNVDSNKDWYWAANTLYVYSTSDPDSAYTNPGIEAGARKCIDSNGANYITIDGLELKFSNREGIDLYNTTNWTIQNNTIYECGGTDHYLAHGIEVDEDNSNVTISDNIIHNIGSHGIYCYKDASDITIESNEIYDCPHNNIDIQSNDANGVSNVIIRRNFLYVSSSYKGPNNISNIYTEVNVGNITGLEIYYNILTDHSTVKRCSGISIGSNVTANIYNNSYDSSGVATNSGRGLQIEGSQAVIVKNNAFKVNDNIALRVIDSTNKTIDYNCYDCTSGNLTYIDDKTGGDGPAFTEAEWSSYKSETGFDAFSINDNPKFTNPMNGDFILKSSSLCLNSGTDVGLTQDYDGNTVPNGWAVDIGAYEYQGSISPPLSAETNASTTSGYVPLAVSFSGSASGGTAPYSYSWDLGDGSSSSDQNPSHTYSSAGTYTVTLTVTDSSSSEATDSLIITTTSPTSALSGSASASTTSGEAPLTVNFTGSASGGTSPYSYSWNFGDGQSSSSQNPSHTYSSAGSYSVTLTVTDSVTNQASSSIAITAQTQISALATSCTASPTSGDIPLTVNFTGTAAGGLSPYTYSWNFGDGESSTAQNPSHTYTQAGSYTATLTVTDSTTSQATASTEVTASSPVHEVTVPDTPEGPSTGALGVSYTYITGGSSCSQGHSIEYYFDWGDGTYSSWSSSTSASHIWSAAGTYSVKVQARCSVNPGVTSLWSGAKTVSLEESPNFQLYISSATASPASGQGGSTNPDTGTYPYPAGNTAQVTALPATNYRFSKWTGDISGSDSYNSEITFNMDQDKSISALFCTQCGDVNGDLSITPADAQYVFEMFLGIISNATETQKENADVNCDGTATEPNITPADAQAIFEKFLGISELPGDCSCRSRADASSTAFTQNNRSQTAPLEIQPGTPNIQLTIDDIDARFKREITIPVRINNPFNIKSFGFDLIFESGTLEFAGIEIGSLLNGFTMVDANEISEGVVRVGGFSSEPIMTSSPSVLVRLKFRILGKAKEPSPLSITNTFDDIKNAATRSGVVFYKEINNKIMRNKDVF